MKSRHILSLSFLLAVVFFALPQEIQAQKGEKSMGILAGATTRNSTGIAGLYFQYNITNHFRLAPNITYAFRRHDVDAFAFNLNAQVPLAPSVDSKFNIYPLAGLNYTSWNYHHRGGDADDDSSSRDGRFGFNIGAGVEYYIFPTMKIAFESKCHLVKNYTGGVFTLSIGYVF